MNLTIGLFIHNCVLFCARRWHRKNMKNASDKREREKIELCDAAANLAVEVQLRSFCI